MAGNGHDPAGARSAGMAHAGLNFRDIWAIYHNQAGLAQLSTSSAGIFYENRFLVREMAFAGFAAAHPLGKGALGISYSNFGALSYREGKTGLAYGMKLSDVLSVGVQLNYHHTRISVEDYGQKGFLTAEVGFQYALSERVSLAAHIFNPTRTKMNDFANERIPTLLRFGVGYHISDELFATAEVEKDIDMDATFRGGLEYMPAEILYLRIGASNSPNLFAFGMGLDLKSFRFDLATIYHSVMGFSPQISLTYSPSKK